MNPLFQYYPANIKQSVPLGHCSLEYFVNAIRNPKTDTRAIFEAIRAAEEAGDMGLKSQLKTRLYSFTPCAYVNGSRKYANITHWTGIAMLDWDHLDPQYCEEFKTAIFNEYPFIVSAWISASRHGVRAIVCIPVCYSVEEFKHYFNALEQEFSIYHGWDRATKNCILPLFMSYDPNILYRQNPTQWAKKYIPPERPPVRQYIVNDQTSRVEAIMVSAIRKITDNGHPQLRAAAYSLGGYVGAGYIDSDTAFAIISNLIRSNAYLSQKPDVYTRTAKTMIDKGSQTPLYL